MSDRCSGRQCTCRISLIVHLKDNQMIVVLSNINCRRIGNIISKCSNDRLLVVRKKSLERFVNCSTHNDTPGSLRQNKGHSERFQHIGSRTGWRGQTGKSYCAAGIGLSDLTFPLIYLAYLQLMVHEVLIPHIVICVNSTRLFFLHDGQLITGISAHSRSSRRLMRRLAWSPPGWLRLARSGRPMCGFRTWRPWMTCWAPTLWIFPGIGFTRRRTCFCGAGQRLKRIWGGESRACSNCGRRSFSMIWPTP